MSGLKRRRISQILLTDRMSSHVPPGPICLVISGIDMVLDGLDRRQFGKKQAAVPCNHHLFEAVHVQLAAQSSTACCAPPKSMRVIILAILIFPAESVATDF